MTFCKKNLCFPGLLICFFKWLSIKSLLNWQFNYIPVKDCISWTWSFVIFKVISSTGSKLKRPTPTFHSSRTSLAGDTSNSSSPASTGAKTNRAGKRPPVLRQRERGRGDPAALGWGGISLSGAIAGRALTVVRQPLLFSCNHSKLSSSTKHWSLCSGSEMIAVE